MLSQANTRIARTFVLVALLALASRLEAQQGEPAGEQTTEPGQPAAAETPGSESGDEDGDGAEAPAATDGGAETAPAQGADGTEPEEGAEPVDTELAADQEVVYLDDDWEEPAETAPRMPSARQAALAVRGRGVYLRYCATCHGRAGDGLGPTARYSPSRPRNFTTGVYKWRTTPSGTLPTDEDLLRTVRRGAPGTNMPAWSGRIPDADIQAAVQYIKTLSPRFEEEGVPAPLSMPSHRPAFDDAARRRGRLLYVLMQCWTCHGMDGTGNGPAADTLEDDEGRPIQAYDFTEGQYRGGRRPIDIYRTFTTGVNGTPMPEYHEALMVGRDGFEDLSQYEEALSRSGMAALREYVRRMPTTEEIWSMPEEERLEWAAQARWDMVAYVLALSRGGAVWRYLFSPPYRTR